MSNCKHCGSPLRPGAKFCAKCGSSVVDDVSSNNSSQNRAQETTIPETEIPKTIERIEESKPESGKGKSNIIKIALGILVLLIAAFLFLGKSDGKSDNKETASTNVKQEQPTANSADAVLAKFGIKGKIGNSTFGNNKDGFMASVDNKIYVVDLKNNQVARVENYSFILNDLLKKRGRISESTLIPQFLIYNDKHDKDADKGEWRGDNHFLPVYILIQFDAAGNVKSKGKMSSGKGAAPSHYQGFLEEQKNIDLANIFLRDISSFMDSSDASVAPNPSPVYYGIINANDVNVRKGPGKNYKSLGVFFKGDKLRLVSEASDAEGGNINWYQIEFDNPHAGLIKGWVRKDFINLAK